MKKVILALVAIFGFGIMVQAQSLSSEDAQKISKEINSSIDKIDLAIQKTDWGKIQKVIEETVGTLVKNAESIAQIIEEVDLSKLEGTMSKLQEEMDKEVNAANIDSNLKGMSKRLEVVLEDITKKVEGDKKTK